MFSMFLTIEGWGRHEVCLCWDRAKSIPKNLVVNNGCGLLVANLRFETFFGACFKCNVSGPFAIDCPMSPPPEKTVPHIDGKDSSTTTSSMVVVSYYEVSLGEGLTSF